MLAGASAGLSAARVFSRAGVWDHDLDVAIFLAYLGFGLRYADYTTLYCREGSAIDSTRGQASQKIEQANDDPPTTTSDESIRPNMTATYAFAMVYIAANFCQHIAESVAVPDFPSSEGV